MKCKWEGTSADKLQRDKIMYGLCKSSKEFPLVHNVTVNIALNIGSNPQRHLMKFLYSSKTTFFYNESLHERFTCRKLKNKEIAQLMTKSLVNFLYLNIVMTVNN